VSGEREGEQKKLREEARTRENPAQEISKKVELLPSKRNRDFKFKS
jgi:hypothetical protein